MVKVIDLKDNLNELRKNVLVSFTLLTFVSAIVGVLFYFYAEFLVNILLGNKWIGLSGNLYILIVPFLLRFIGRSLSGVLISTGNNRLFSFWQICGFIIMYTGLQFLADYHEFDEFLRILRFLILSIYSILLYFLLSLSFGQIKLFRSER